MDILHISQSDSGNEYSLRCDDGFYKVTRADFVSLFGTPDVKTPIALTDEQTEELLFLAEKFGAIKYALYLLGFSDKSEKALLRKMREKKYSQKACDEALSVLKKNGYLNDAASCERKCELMASSKLYGPRRIISELIAKGYTRECAQEALDRLDIDFEESLKSLFEKLTKGNVPCEREAKNKLFAKLARYGYDYGLINTIFYEFCDEDDI